MCAKHVPCGKIDFRIFCVWLAAAALLGSLLTYAYFAFSLSSRGPFDVGEGQIRLVTDRDYFPAVTGLISSANTSVHMMMYDMRFYFSFPKSSVNRVVEGMEDALGRGVDVKIITSRKATSRDVIVTIDARNMSIRYDSANTTSGANFIIIDSKIVIIGSSHLEHYSFEANREANVIIYSEALARQMETYFEKAWVEYEQQK
ncbi:MAG: phospholipase D-like domain-containing protein [Candidatus Aenigmatarchaeota archaeon]